MTTLQRKKNKLAGVAAEATANDTDVNLKARANHTGTQAQSTINNLTTDLGNKAPLASPTFTGTPTVPTASAGTNTTQSASTAFVTDAVASMSSTVPTHNLDLAADNYVGRALHLRPNGMTATANLTIWSDSSGNGRDVTQVTAANQPDVVENVLNGFPVVRFDGVDDTL